MNKILYLIIGTIMIISSPLFLMLADGILDKLSKNFTSFNWRYYLQTFLAAIVVASGIIILFIGMIILIKIIQL